MIREDGDPRTAPRYVAHAPLSAEFGDTPVRLLNLSVSGAMIEHRGALAVGVEQPLRLNLDSMKLQLAAEVIWTVERSDDGTSRTGVRFTEWIEVAQGAIDRLCESGALRLDAGSPPGFRERVQ